jgi:hypothetical protein
MKDSARRSGRSPDWLKMKISNAPAVKREAEEESGKKRGENHDLYRIPEIVTLGRFPGGGESDSRWRTKEVRHVGSDTLTRGF